MKQRSPNWTRRALLAGGGAIAGAAALGLGYLAMRKGGAVVTGVSRAKPVANSAQLPKEADVVVVGGGNVGAMTALTLAERGLRVVLCEKGVIAGEASGRSLGYIDSQFLDPVKMEIVGRSKELWEGMNARVGGETGYRRSGLSTLFGSQDGLDAAAGWLESVKGQPGVDARILTAKEALAMAPGLTDSIAGALYQPSDAVAEPQLAAPAMAEAVKRAGGTVMQNCAVRGVETSGGRISGVVTEKGAIRCSAVVLAGGVWSPVFARSLGLDLPQFMAFASVARVAPSDGPTTALILEKRGVVARRTLNGSYDVCIGMGSAPITPTTIANLFRLRPAMENMASSIEPVLNLSTFFSQWRIPKTWDLNGPSPFEANRIFMPEVHNGLLDQAVQSIGEALPSLANRPVTERWAGSLMSTLDNMPVISGVEGHPGLFIGSGFYYGLTMAPAAAEALADLVMARKPAIDLSLYRFERFSDGSPTVFRA